MSSFQYKRIMNLNQNKNNTNFNLNKNSVIKINNQVVNVYKYYHNLILPNKNVLELYKPTLNKYMKSVGYIK
jgi:hypothetical protein